MECCVQISPQKKKTFYVHLKFTFRLLATLCSGTAESGRVVLFRVYRNLLVSWIDFASKKSSQLPGVVSQCHFENGASSKISIKRPAARRLSPSMRCIDAVVQTYFWVPIFSDQEYIQFGSLSDETYFSSEIFMYGNRRFRCRRK